MTPQCANVPAERQALWQPLTQHMQLFAPPVKTQRLVTTTFCLRLSGNILGGVPRALSSADGRWDILPSTAIIYATWTQEQVPGVVALHVVNLVLAWKDVAAKQISGRRVPPLGTSFLVAWQIGLSQ